MLFRNISFFLLLFLTFKGVVGDEVVRIKSVDGFKNFVNGVNSGTNYLGTTVFLDSDLSFSRESIKPIGDDYPNYFLGVFDGQGHIISDLKMNSSSSGYTGLFGYSTGLTIRNVVLDSSCSITSSYNYYAYVGGIIGDCYANDGHCNIENSVNMADVAFSGTISEDSLCLGGIVGQLSSSSYHSCVKNCANYGSVTHSGDSDESHIGGIVGALGGLNSYNKYIYNCLNHGTITHSGTSSHGLYLGGVVGYSWYAYIENCVSAGKISTQNTPSYSHIGSIVGYVYSGTFINYCYYTSELSGYDLYGTGTPSSSSYTLSYDNTTFELSGTVSVGSYTGNSLINALNAYSDYYFLRDYPKWLLNKEEKSVTFTINSRTSPITMGYQVILLPSLASEGSISFDGWYNDDEHANPLESFEVNEDETLYGRFEENTNNYTITFDTRREGSSVAPITAQFGTVVLLPSDLTRDQCDIAWWETEYGDDVGLSLTMPARNFTLYAVWKCIHITTPEEFLNFSKAVNSGTTNYSGITVYLDSDLSLTGEALEPIGKSRYSNYFLGVFDGQGHIISDLKMSSSSQYAGLFGGSKGLTIRNVVLDSSCSITSSFSGSYDIYVGGIIGDCYADSGQCSIENSVNMADVTFSGEINGYNYLVVGGIVGWLESSSDYSIYVKNCANYGSVTHSGDSGDSYIGGVVGYICGYEVYTYLQNCLNHGTITHSGTTLYELYLGGIVGYSEYASIENCVSAGKISLQNIPSEESYIGSIVGYVDRDIHINHCYYTSELSEYDLYGKGIPESSSYTLSYDNITFKLNETVPVGSYTGTSLISTLNAGDYYSLSDYSKWLLNKEKKSVAFTINSRTSPITMDYQVILLPSLATEVSMTFEWYKDNKCSNILSSFEVTKDTTLYGRFEENTKKYTITFDTRREGSSFASITAQFGAAVSLPSYCVSSWETIYGDNVGLSLTMPAHNFILYAVWKCTHIETPDDFLNFSNVVNSGTDDYNGITVLLESDLSLSGETLEPIGSYSNYFCGTFDGQGHTISDLKIETSTSLYAGLFGFSDGFTIRNVVLDSSCSITNSYNSYNVYVGGIIGKCEAYSGQCNIENSVNMADVAFSGTIVGRDYDSHLGGIAGYLVPSGYPIYVKNCANYGSVIHSGGSKYLRVGGIAGELSGSSSNYIYLYNCLNYGTITHSGTTLYTLYLGGIVGYTWYTYIENCVSAGEISTQTKPSASHIGGIVGFFYSDSGTHIGHCYYTSDADINKPSRHISYSPKTARAPTSATTVDSALVDKLNSYASDNGWNEWLFNEKNVFVTFVINHGDGFTVNSQVILFPDPVVDDGNNFTGWYKDSSFKKTFSSSSISSDITLYGQLIVKDQKYYSGSDSSDKSANHAGVLNPFMQLVYFLL